MTQGEATPILSLDPMGPAQTITDLAPTGHDMAAQGFVSNAGLFACKLIPSKLQPTSNPSMSLLLKKFLLRTPSNVLIRLVWIHLGDM